MESRLLLVLNEPHFELSPILNAALKFSGPSPILSGELGFRRYVLFWLAAYR
jgi:hypothetical protein